MSKKKISCQKFSNPFLIPAKKIVGRMNMNTYADTSVKEAVKELYPPTHVKVQVTNYYVAKLAKCLLVLFAGVLLAGLIFIDEQKDCYIQEGESELFVVREDVGGRSKEIEVETKYEGEKEEWTISVNPTEYTMEEFEKICDEISQKLPQLILGENENLEEVNKDLILIEQYETYPIAISWQLDDYTYVSSDGKVDVSELEKKEGEPVVLTAVLAYGDYERIESFPINVVPQELTGKEALLEKVKEFFSKEERKQKYEETFQLPQSIDGKSVTVTEKKPENAKLILLFTVVAGILVYFLQDKDLQKETVKRRQQLLRDYPGFVNKLVLYMGAGMTTKMAMEKQLRELSAQESKEKNYLREELKLFVHSMENGVSIQEAYVMFGERTKVSQYRNLLALLSQNDKKGTKDILKLLDEESKKTFELRKKEAKKLGEQAGTKLLLPMVMMLGIVMVLIMIPAFLTYQL